MMAAAAAAAAVSGGSEQEACTRLCWTVYATYDNSNPVQFGASSLALLLGDFDSIRFL